MSFFVPNRNEMEELGKIAMALYRMRDQYAKGVVDVDGVDSTNVMDSWMMIKLTEMEFRLRKLEDEVRGELARIKELSKTI